jgi:hypothetical protein
MTWPDAYDDLDACYAHMRTQPAALKHVLQAFAIGRDVGPLKKLAGIWKVENMRKQSA